jgi:precorrin-3B C17-methyltransferase
VALISSGDAGVRHGRADLRGAVPGRLDADSDIEVEIIPGASALNTCAALVGAPLTHDFCAISLSDLLTPWPTIARRLDAVAYADFVVALYNPKSGRRTSRSSRPSASSCATAIRHAGGHRQIGLPAQAAHRIHHPGQDDRADIGMLSTVLIGNSNTFIKHGLMVTPRGYANKYAVEDGGATPMANRPAARCPPASTAGWPPSSKRQERRRTGRRIPPAGGLHRRRAAGRTAAGRRGGGIEG